MGKIVIFGSTGLTGLAAVEAAVNKGLNVRAFVREPDKLPENLRKKVVDIVQGDVLNYNDVLNAIKGVTAVVIAIGTRQDFSPTTLLSEGTKNIIKAMKEEGVEVVSVCSSGFTSWDFSKIPTRAHDLTKDHIRQLDVVKNCGLKYIVILSPHIADYPGSEYIVKHDEYLGKVISKYDLGKFVIECLDMPEHYGRICGICTKIQNTVIF